MAFSFSRKGIRKQRPFAFADRARRRAAIRSFLPSPKRAGDSGYPGAGALHERPDKAATSRRRRKSALRQTEERPPQLWL